MNIDDDIVEVENVPGRASKIDKWKYNDILNDIARRGLYVLGTPQFSYWSKRFVRALRIVNLKNLPLKKMIDERDEELKEELYYSKERVLKKNFEVWYDAYKRDSYLTKWEEDYWEALFEYCLELATKAGFTLHLDSIDESIALRMNY